METKTNILGFQVYEGNSALENLGNLNEFLNPTDSIMPLLNRKRADGTMKRVTLVIKREDGTSTTLTCSQKLSDGLRNKEIALSQAIGFPVIENEEGVRFLSIPTEVTNLPEFKVSALKVKAFKPVAVANPLELVI